MLKTRANNNGGNIFFLGIEKMSGSSWKKRGPNQVEHWTLVREFLLFFLGVMLGVFLSFVRTMKRGRRAWRCWLLLICDVTHSTLSLSDVDVVYKPMDPSLAPFDSAQKGNFFLLRGRCRLGHTAKPTRAKVFQPPFFFSKTHVERDRWKKVFFDRQNQFCVRIPHQLVDNSCPFSLIQGLVLKKIRLLWVYLYIVFVC